MLTGVLYTLLVQEYLYSPSRVSATVLQQKGWLPSSISHVSKIQPFPNSTALDVHYLLYESTSTLENKSVDAVYFNHGFGASSLSWLPAMPSIVNSLGGKLGIAHDAAGFGFTERTFDSFDPQSASSAVGKQLLLKKINGEGASTNVSPEPQTVALFGHSLGSITSLKMALGLPSSMKKFVFLVAPAIMYESLSEMVEEKKMSTPMPVSKALRVAGKSFRAVFSKPIRAVLSFARKFFVEVPFYYFLKRLVSYKQFWKKGLAAAVADSSRVSESTLLRYRWPSVAENLEKGLISFVKAQMRYLKNRNTIKMLEDLVELPNITIFILHGSKDPIVPISNSEALAQRFPQIRLLSLEGYGHNPHEENIDFFVQNVYKLVNEAQTSGA